ncbi:MAG: lipopolysaccharide biosynthesis protein [Chloroflexi bacterium]|nr:MAG: lipopolysaccharide biosynthesis protein [Chloroflexota bacterium]
MTSFFVRPRRLAADTAWVFAGQGATALATLVGVRLITEIVPPATYGTVALVLGVLALAQGVAVGPLMQAVLRFYPEYAAAGREMELRWGALYALRRPALVILGVLAVLGAVWIFSEPRKVWLIVFAFILLGVEIVRLVEVTFLNAAGRQREMALLMAADAWMRPLFAVVLVWLYGVGDAPVIAGYVGGCSLALAAFWLVTRRRRSRSDGLPQGAMSFTGTDVSQRLWAYALPLTLLPFIGWVSGQADRYLLASMSDIASAGIYAALYGLASKPFLIFSNSVEFLLRQPYYSYVSVSDKIGERIVLYLWIGIVVAGGLIFYMIYSLFYMKIAGLMLAAEYRAYSTLMGWIAGGHILLLVAQVLERVCYAHHDTRGVVWAEAAGALFSLIASTPLIFLYGIAGAAWAVPVYFGIQLLVTFARVRWVLRKRRDSSAVSSSYVAI